MQAVDVLARCNPSKYYPVFERLCKDDTHAHIRRGVSRAYSLHTRKPLNHRRDARYPLPLHLEQAKKSSNLSLLSDLLDVFGDCVKDTLVNQNVKMECSIEAQRVECCVYQPQAFMEARGAHGILCVNSYNASIEVPGGLLFEPGHLYLNICDAIPIARLGGGVHALYGTVDCFLFHLH